MPTAITTLELRSEAVPEGPIARLYQAEHERLTGRPLMQTVRHYLAGQPVHCGDILELYDNGIWIRGRYEWSMEPKELPTLETGERVLRIVSGSVLRRPSGSGI